jgi:hypothetical protein
MDAERPRATAATVLPSGEQTTPKTPRGGGGSITATLTMVTTTARGCSRWAGTCRCEPEREGWRARWFWRCGEAVQGTRQSRASRVLEAPDSSPAWEWRASKETECRRYGAIGNCRVISGPNYGLTWSESRASTGICTAAWFWAEAII